MSLTGLAVAVLWFLIGVIVLCGIVYVAFYVLRMFLTIPPMVEKAVWVIVMLLVLIYLITIIAGGGAPPIHITR